MLYLATNVIDLIDQEDEEIAPGEYYDFLWNRLRAIKKDITQQDLKSESSVLLMERCARFHIYSAHRFIEEEMGVFDTKMNNENLVKTMRSLKDLYDDLSLHNGIQCPNEAEFRCYDILLNLCNGEMLRSISKIKSSIRNSEPVKFALRVHQAFTSNNFVKFFNLMKETTLLNACIMHRYFGLMRYSAFQLLKKAFTTASQREELLPKHYIFDLLCFEEDDEFDEFCRQIEIEIDDNENVVLRREIRTQVFLPTGHTSRRSIEYIDAKKGRKRLSEIIYNEKMNENPYRKYALQTSFDENGQLLDGQIKLDNQTVKVDQKIVYTFAESKNTKSQETTTSTTNKFASKDKPEKSSSVNFGPAKGLFSQPQNLFNKQSLFTGQQQSSSDQTTLFGKKPTLFGQPTTVTTQQSTNLFSMPSTGANQNLFGNKDSPINTSNLFSEPATTKNLFSKATTQPDQKPVRDKSFHFKIPSNISLPSTTSNLFSNVEQSDKQEFLFKLPDPIPRTQQPEDGGQIKTETKERKLNETQELSSLSASVFQSLLEDVLNDLVSRSVLNVFINDHSIQLTNSILNDVVFELTNELCKSAYSDEKTKLEELRRLIGQTSGEMCRKLIDEQVTQLVSSVARRIYLQELDRFIHTKSELFANSYFEETFEQLVFEICYQTHQTELRERKRIVAYIREKRGWRLAGHYFRHWKRRCDYLKRYRFLRDNFPASRMESSPPVLKRIHSVPDLNAIEQPFKRRLVEINDHHSVLPNSSFASQLNSTRLPQSTRSSMCLDLAKESRIQEELDELREKFKKREKIDELSTKSKLEYAKRALDSLKKVSLTFNRSLEYVRPFLNSSSGHKK